MTIRLRTLFFIGIGVLIIWFLYIARAILAPFVLGAIFAYIFNPVVNFFSERIKLPRTLSVIIIYLLLIALIIAVASLLTKRVLHESTEFTSYIKNVITTTQNQVEALPDWARPITKEMLSTLEESKIFSLQSVFSFFPEAISRIVSFFIFLVSGFYFLKEGRKMVDSLILLVPKPYKIEVEILLRKINVVLNGYLRGQIFLIAFVALALFIALSILGIKFALILAIFSGFAEVVPIIGPIVATSVAALVVLVTGTANFSFSPLTAALIVIVIYFLVRQFEDYFVIPYVMAKITEVHPFLIFFAVLSGGHLFGVLGFILAIPVAATIKIFLEFSLDRIYISEKKTPIKSG